MNLKRIVRRRRFILDGSLQVRLLLYSVGYVLFYTIAIGAGLFVPLMIQFSNANQSSPQALTAATGFLYLHYHFWPVALLSVVVVALHSILASHRMAGPLFRFRHILRELKEGTIPEAIQLRRRDFLQSEMQSVNEMLAGLRSRISEIQRSESLLRQSIAECQRRVALLDDVGISQCVEELAKRGELLAEATHAIHIKQ